MNTARREYVPASIYDTHGRAGWHVTVGGVGWQVRPSGAVVVRGGGMMVEVHDPTTRMVAMVPGVSPAILADAIDDAIGNGGEVCRHDYRGDNLPAVLAALRA